MNNIRKRIHGGTWKNRLAALKNLPPVFKLLWDADPKLVATSIILRAFLALLPLAALWVGKQIIDLIVAAARNPGFDHSEIWRWLAAEFAVGVLATALSRAVDYLDGRIADHFSKEVSLRVMGHAAALDLQSVEDPQFHDRMERARVQGTDRIVMLNCLGRLLQQLITFASLSMSILWFSPTLLAVMVVAAVPAFLGESHFAFLEYALAYSLTPLRRESDYLRDLSTKKEGLKEQKVFGLANFFLSRFRSVADETIHLRQKLAKRRFLISACLGALSSLGYYAAYAFLAFQALNGVITVGTLTFLAGALAGCSSQIQLVFSAFTSIADQALFLTDLIELFGMKPQIPNAPNPIPAPRKIQDGFEFLNVSFAYPHSNRTVLKDINLRIGAGEKIALVGANGQGKTTLVKLISRLYDPTGGRILLDGIDLREYDVASLHQRIGVIFQDFMRYDLTARENIAMGYIDRQDNEGLIFEAAHESGASELLQRLPDGLDQMLGRRFQDGVELSGGEWQKIALARAYLRDAEILILDEPTASLDAVSEHEVFSRFAELTAGKTALLISHRLSTVRMADRIVVLQDGVIQEQGTHRQLMAGRRSYAHMFELQASSYRFASNDDVVEQLT